MSSLRRDRGHLPRLDSEQHIEVPEPVLKREPETTPPFTTGSSQSARPRRKRDSRMLREIEARNRIPESSSGSDEERLFVKQATNSSQPASQKRRRTSKMLRELEAHNRSPKGSPDSEQDEIFVRNRRSSQSVSLEPKRKSKLLRELEAHNQSPEPEPGRHDLKDDWGDFGRTRGARKELEDIFNGTPSTPRKSMSVKTLMLEQFSGKEKDTKTFYAEDDSDLALRSCRRQQNCMNAMFEEEGDEEGEEEDFLQNLRTNGRSHPQLIPARRTRPSQANMPIRNRQRVEDVATEMVWPTLDKQKGQSPLALFCIFSFPALRVKRFRYYLPPNFD